MAVPLRISYRGIEPAAHLDRLIAQEVEQLEDLANIVGCRVVLTGTPYRLHISLSAVREELFIQTCANADPAYGDPEFAIRAAFEKARRALRYSNAPSRAAI